MRVLIDALQVGNLSGTGVYTRRIVEHLLAGGTEAEFVLIWPKEAAGPNLRSPARMKIMYTSTGSPFIRTAREQWCVLRAAGKVDPCIIHYPASIGPWLPGSLARSMLRRSVVTVHDLAYLKFPDRFPASRRLYYRVAMLRGARRAAHIIADSESTKRDLVELGGIAAGRVTVVYAGVEKTFTPVNDAHVIETVREKYALPERFYLFVGTIEPRKNVSCIVEAFRTLAHEQDIDLVVAGRCGWRFQNLYRRIETAGLTDRILMPGRIDDQDLPAVYSCAEAFVWPTLYEGFGLPLLEAMACGTPVISSAIDVVKEVVGSAAVLVDPRSPAELADAMQRVVSSQTLRDEMVGQGLDRARQFPWERSAEKTIAVYRQVANGI